MGKPTTGQLCPQKVQKKQFFPVVEVGPLCAEQIAQAKAVCAQCPVRDECLSFALTQLPHGIAGGLTAEERRGLVANRRRQRRAKRPSHVVASA